MKEVVGWKNMVYHHLLSNRCKSVHRARALYPVGCVAAMQRPQYKLQLCPVLFAHDLTSSAFVRAISPSLGCDCNQRQDSQCDLSTEAPLSTYNALEVTLGAGAGPLPMWWPLSPCLFSSQASCSRRACSTTQPLRAAWHMAEELLRWQA